MIMIMGHAQWAHLFWKASECLLITQEYLILHFHGKDLAKYERTFQRLYLIYLKRNVTMIFSN